MQARQFKAGQLQARQFKAGQLQARKFQKISAKTTIGREIPGNQARKFLAIPEKANPGKVRQGISRKF